MQYNAQPHLATQAAFFNGGGGEQHQTLPYPSVNSLSDAELATQSARLEAVLKEQRSAVPHPELRSDPFPSVHPIAEPAVRSAVVGGGGGGGGDSTRAPLIPGASKAVYIAVSYHGTSWALEVEDTMYALQGCLQGAGFSAQRQVLVERSAAAPTKAGVLSAIAWLVVDAQPGDSLVFAFIGHGGPHADGLTHSIAPLDCEANGVITDKELQRALLEPLPAGVRLTCFFDLSRGGAPLTLPRNLTFEHGVVQDRVVEGAGGGYVQAQVCSLSATAGRETVVGSVFNGFCAAVSIHGSAEMPVPHLLQGMSTQTVGVCLGSTPQGVQGDAPFCLGVLPAQRGPAVVVAERELGAPPQGNHMNQSHGFASMHSTATTPRLEHSSVPSEGSSGNRKGVVGSHTASQILGSYKALLVSDDPGVTRQVARFLVRHGFGGEVRCKDSAGVSAGDVSWLSEEMEAGDSVFVLLDAVPKVAVMYETLTNTLPEGCKATLICQGNAVGTPYKVVCRSPDLTVEEGRVRPRGGMVVAVSGGDGCVAAYMATLNRIPEPTVAQLAAGMLAVHEGFGGDAVALALQVGSTRRFALSTVLCLGILPNGEVTSLTPRAGSGSGSSGLFSANANVNVPQQRAAAAYARPEEVSSAPSLQEKSVSPDFFFTETARSAHHHTMDRNGSPSTTSRSSSSSKSVSVLQMQGAKKENPHHTELPSNTEGRHANDVAPQLPVGDNTQHLVHAVRDSAPPPHGLVYPEETASSLPTVPSCATSGGIHLHHGAGFTSLGAPLASPHLTPGDAPADAPKGVVECEAQLATFCRRYAPASFQEAVRRLHSEPFAQHDGILDHVAAEAGLEGYFTARRRLSAYYSRVNPSKISQLDVILGEYLNSWEELFSDLHERYGPELPQDAIMRRTQPGANDNAWVQEAQKRFTSGILDNTVHNVSPIVSPARSPEHTPRAGTGGLSAVDQSALSISALDTTNGEVLLKRKQDAEQRYQALKEQTDSFRKRVEAIREVSGVGVGVADGGLGVQGRQLGGDLVGDMEQRRDPSLNNHWQHWVTSPLTNRLM